MLFPGKLIDTTTPTERYYGAALTDSYLPLSDRQAFLRLAGESMPEDEDFIYKRNIITGGLSGLTLGALASVSTPVVGQYIDTVHGFMDLAARSSEDSALARVFNAAGEIGVESGSQYTRPISTAMAAATSGNPLDDIRRAKIFAESLGGASGRQAADAAWDRVVQVVGAPSPANADKFYLNYTRALAQSSGDIKFSASDGPKIRKLITGVERASPSSWDITSKSIGNLGLDEKATKYIDDLEHAAVNRRGTTRFFDNVPKKMMDKLWGVNSKIGTRGKLMLTGAMVGAGALIAGLGTHKNLEHVKELLASPESQQRYFLRKNLPIPSTTGTPLKYTPIRFGPASMTMTGALGSMQNIGDILVNAPVES